LKEEEAGKRILLFMYKSNEIKPDYEGVRESLKEDLKLDIQDLDKGVFYLARHDLVELERKVDDYIIKSVIKITPAGKDYVKTNLL